MSDMARPTSDIDLHTYEVQTHDEILALFGREVAVQDDDGFSFEIAKTAELEHEHS
ncbi:hypothetical protein N5K21_25350 [Rhizobium pusense]|uniref:Uncharacterized protein n=1 Tax=Agrobacterium pusense TaxID=648995 RepID=A0A6H0ZPB4_9HYPH|nr:hypothetical protein [Agrobacterium pusense]MDH2092057.1 hypothetical protein [Agrobacterium pusense]QIX22598.1 hypothetical protein FOB41_16330 [Agrobacterium pusense]WCK24509.1 hypothetical protein CFBP5496_0002630 [Agrobacterium pusense]